LDNKRGSLLMVASMAAFALEDMFIKAATGTLPVGQVLIFFGVGGTLIFMGLTYRRGERVLHPAIMSPLIIIRAICEVIGRLCFTLAIALTPLSSASAILQATPLVVALGGVVFFSEKVGLRRWLAIGVGFVGVLLIIRPGLDGFEMASLFAVAGTLGFAGRDLATRAAPAVLSNVQLGVYGFFMLSPTGIVMLIYTGGWVWPSVLVSAQLGAAVIVGVLAYYSLTAAMRMGEISVVAPFRYTRLVFALILGSLVFSETPDFMTLAGSAVIVLSGLYTVIRSRKLGN